MIIKKHLEGSYVRIVFLSFIALLGSGCSDEQQLHRSSQVETTFQLKSGSGLNGAFTIQHAYLKLDRVVVSGVSAGKNLPNTTLSIPADEPPFRLVESDSSHIRYTLPARQYDVMDLSLFLFADQYELVLAGRPEEHIPEPVGSNVGGAGGGQESPSDGSLPDDDDSDTDSGNNTGDESDENGTSGNGDHDDDDDGSDEDKNENENTEDDDQEDDDRNDDDQEDDGDDRDEEEDDDDKKKDNDEKDKKNKDKDDDDDDDDDGKDDRRSSSASIATVDLDHFFQNAKPGMVVFGTLEYSTQKINVIFVVTDPAEISVRAMQGSGSRIVLEQQNASVVRFDAEQWVEGLTEKDFEDAVLQLYKGQAVLFIHKDFNGALFEKLFSRLTPSASFRFDNGVAE